MKITQSLCALALTLFAFAHHPSQAQVSLPSVGAYDSGYRNIFTEQLGKSQSDEAGKIDAIWKQLFYGDPNSQRIYYKGPDTPDGKPTAYIWYAEGDDVRNEGMGYGLMMCVQLNHQAEFDALWRFVRADMYNASGKWNGLFAWHVRPNGDHLPSDATDNMPGPDGDQWMAAALLCASGRWGNGGGIDYRREADAVLTGMIHKYDWSGGSVNSEIETHDGVYLPSYDMNHPVTDPSYVMPAFTEMFARWASADRPIWANVTTKGRWTYLPAATNRPHALSPYLTYWDGSPNTGAGGDYILYTYDTWRTINNITLDYYWWHQPSWGVPSVMTDRADKLLDFFAPMVDTFGAAYDLDGSYQYGSHSAGHVGMVATACLASTHDNTSTLAWVLWNSTSAPTGAYRYYDACLYFLAMLELSGNMRCYTPQ